MRFNRFAYLLLLLLCVLATKSIKYIGDKKKLISPEESPSVRLIVATGLDTMLF